MAYGTSSPVAQDKRRGTPSKRGAAASATLGLVLLGSLAAFYNVTPGAIDMTTKAMDAPSSVSTFQSDYANASMLNASLPSTDKGLKKWKRKAKKGVNNVAKKLDKTFSQLIDEKIEYDMGAGTICCDKQKDVRSSRGWCSVTVSLCIGTASSRFTMDATKIPPKASLKLKPVITATVSGDCDGSFTVSEEKEQKLLSAYGADAMLTAGYEFTLTAGVHGSVSFSLPTTMNLKARVAGAAIVPDSPSASVQTPYISSSLSAETTFVGKIKVGFAASGLNIMSIGADAVAKTKGGVLLRPNNVKVGRPQISVGIVLSCGLDMALDLPAPNVCGNDITFGAKLPSFSKSQEKTLYSKDISI